MKIFPISYSRYVRALQRRIEGERAFILKDMPTNSICCEIGVDEGDFSKMILKITKPKKLFLIDPWENSWRHGLTQNEMDEKHDNVQSKFKSEIKSGQVEVKRGYSDQVLAKFPDEYFDWVYIDGNHVYEFVKKDLNLAYAKLKKGGIITGDDYGKVGWWNDGVTKAVDEFSSNENMKLKVKHNQFILSET